MTQARPRKPATLSGSPRLTPAPRGRMLTTDIYAVVGAVLLVTTGLWAKDGGITDLLHPWVDTVLSLGRLSGLYAALFAMAGLILAARPRVLERRYGLDKMLGWHRIVGITTVALVAFHAVVDTVGWGLTSSVNPIAALIDLIRTQSWMLAAVASAVLFIIIGLSSWRRIRQRVSYETWYYVHITAYLAVLLAFGHQLTLGTDISGNTLALVWWIGLFVITFGWVLYARFADLLRAITRGRLEITRVTKEAPGVGSVHINGPGLRHMHATAGQFFMLRVAHKGLWWQPHPYSLSSAPTRDGIRFTVKELGDGSFDILRCKKGTRVILEGPYGRFTAENAQGSPVVLFGAGVGIAPLRALLEDVHADQDPIVILRASREEEIVHRKEMEQLVADRGGRLFILAGPRAKFGGGDPFRPDLLEQAVPDIRSRHSYICGPHSFEYALERSLRALKVPTSAIHRERFGI